MKFLILTLFLFFSFIELVPSTEQQYTSVFSFGDSLADTGNFLNSGAVFFPSISNLPYGMTYFKHATGRCSDGRLVVDFIAEALGLPLLPPYLGKEKDFHRGVNFAVSGATAMDRSFFREIGAELLLWTNMSLSMQIGWFEQLKPSLCSTTKDCNDYFNKSLFLVGEIGGNDYNYAFLSRKSIEQVKTYVPKVVETIIASTQKLIDLGAVHLIIPGDLPIGCSPMYLTLFSSPNKEDYDPQNQCLKHFNGFARYHNYLLHQAIEQLQKKNPKARITYADYYGSAIRFVHTPKHFGFTEGALMTCCGAGGPYNFDMTARCGHPGASTCKDPSSYVNWDGIHLTEAAYRHIANSLLQGPSAEPPIIKHIQS